MASSVNSVNAVSAVTITGNDGKTVFINNTPVVAMAEHEITYKALEVVLSDKMLLYLTKNDWMSNDATVKLSVGSKNELKTDRGFVSLIMEVNTFCNKRVSLGSLFPTHVFTTKENESLKKALTDFGKALMAQRYNTQPDYTGLESV